MDHKKTKKEIDNYEVPCRICNPIRWFMGRTLKEANRNLDIHVMFKHNKEQNKQ